MNTRVKQAFESFLAELQDILSEIVSTIRRKTDEGHFKEISALAQEAQQIEVLIQEVESLRSRWREPRYQPKPPSPRPSRGELTPYSDYEIPILQALVQLGGRAPVQDVLKVVYEIMKDRLKPKDLERPSGRDIRWRNRAQRMRKRLCIRGYLRDDSPYGIWEISEEGREYLKQVQQEQPEP